MTKDSNRLKQIFDNVIAKVISAGIVTIITSSISFFVSKKFGFTTREIWLLVLASVFFIIIVSYLVYRKMNRKLPKLPPIDSDFHVIREERVHKWINENDYIHKRRYTLQALKKGLTKYVDKFQWTGTEYSLSAGDGDYSVVEDQKKNVFNVYHFEFKPLKKGDTIEVEAIWKAKGPADPFFSTTIEKPTDILVMRVELFPESGIKTVNCEEDSNIGTMCPPINNHIEKLNSDGEYVWTVNKPDILHHYEINWNVKK